MIPLYFFANSDDSYFWNTVYFLKRQNRNEYDESILAGIEPLSPWQDLLGHEGHIKNHASDVLVVSEDGSR